MVRKPFSLADFLNHDTMVEPFLYMGIVVSTSLTFVAHDASICIGSGVLGSPAMTYALKTHSSLLLRFVLALYPRGSYVCQVVLLHCMLTVFTFWPEAGFTWTRVLSQLLTMTFAQSTLHTIDFCSLTYPDPWKEHTFECHRPVFTSLH